MRGDITKSIREWMAKQDGPQSRDAIRGCVAVYGPCKTLNVFNIMLRDGMLIESGNGYIIGRLPKPRKSREELDARRRDYDRLRKQEQRRNAGTPVKQRAVAKDKPAPAVLRESGWPKIDVGPTVRPRTYPQIDSLQWEAAGGKVERLPAAWDRPNREAGSA